MVHELLCRHPFLVFLIQAGRDEASRGIGQIVPIIIVIDPVLRDFVVEVVSILRVERVAPCQNEKGGDS